MIRRAVPQDIPAIVSLAIEAVRPERYPYLVLSREKIGRLAVECVSSAQHFLWVAERDGVIGGAVVAVVNEGLWFDRREACVVMFYCVLPGEGIKLLRQFLRWVAARTIIKRVVFTLEDDADPRVGKLLARLGFKRAFPVYVATR